MQGAEWDRVRAELRRVWGYDSFLPLQAEAIDCVLTGRDAVVVLPTGGGKSLCFQLPALCRDGVAIVVSPLIALMKDQVDALRQNGVPAALANSTLARRELEAVEQQVRAGQVRLLYLAPERLLTERTLDFLRAVRVSYVAIDEAHCISAWGHDFRPEYRGLGALRDVLPDVGLCAFTATASERVRQDIAEQLRLRGPAMLVGSFDRPNLVYHARRRARMLPQIREVLQRHAGEAGIVYCISRKEVERVCGALIELGHRAVPYHAGMADEQRERNQDAFLRQEADTMVATVAFGMGIDKSNVRYVIHAGMPKSLESYQQESGRAGRDGLEAECCLFYSGRDYMVWKRMIEEGEPAGRAGAERALAAMWDFCTGVVCRHRALVEYFGQSWEASSCGACDVCLGQLDVVDDALVVGQKILSCVARLGQRFGADYTVKVLHGARERLILQRAHDQLSTWGLLATVEPRTIRDWIEQLVSQRMLVKRDPYQTLEITAEGRRVLRGQRVPRLLRPAQPRRVARATPAEDTWDGVDRGLFDELKRLRQETAARLNVPAYIVFDDRALRDMARRRPTSPAQFRQVRGVGDKKLADHGAAFVQLIDDYCQTHGLAADVAQPTAPPAPPPAAPRLADEPPLSALAAFPLFRAHRTVEQVAGQLGRACSTVYTYLAEFLRLERIVDPSPWVDAETTRRVMEAAQMCGIDRLKPIHEALEGTVPYEQIRIVAACWQNIQARRDERQLPGPVTPDRAGPGSAPPD